MFVYGRRKHTKDERMNYFRDADFSCEACKTILIPDFCENKKENHLTIDHIVPLSRNGIDAPPNYMVLCFSCNQKKSNCEPKQWLNYLADVSDKVCKKVYVAVRFCRGHRISDIEKDVEKFQKFKIPLKKLILEHINFEEINGRKTG